MEKEEAFMKFYLVVTIIGTIVSFACSLGSIHDKLEHIIAVQQEMRYPMEHRIYLDPPGK
jgi:hypothetical protein